MFGLYPSQFGIRSNSSNPLGDNLLPFAPLPAQLGKAGDQTAGFGKTHWGRMDEEPRKRGFEVRVVGANTTKAAHRVFRSAAHLTPVIIGYGVHHPIAST